MLRIVRNVLLSLSAAIGIVILGAASNSASAACGGGDVSCPPPQVDGRTVTVTVTGSLVRAGSGGSTGGTTTVSVPVPCYLTPSWTGKEYFDGIEDGSITSAGWDEWGGAANRWPYSGWRAHETDDEGRWWTPTCRYSDGFEYDDWGDFANDFFLSYPQTFLQPGEQPPDPPVPAEILLQAAQEAMEVPAPEFEHNPDATGPFDTLVNMDTWFWLSDPTQDGSVTASAGANSVTVDATLSDVVFSATNAGAVPCAGTGVEWGPGASSDCTLAFERAGAADVTADTQWTLAWSFNGTPQGAVDPLSASFSQPVTVAESQALVNDID